MQAPVHTLSVSEGLSLSSSQEHRQRQKAARDSKVVMYRKYREGELPDIQIKHAEIIRPFQALAQKDTSLARMLFASLYEAIFKQLESLVTERDAEAIVTAICDGLNAVLKSSTQFYPPLIGSLEVRLLGPPPPLPPK